ncbi:hypothetical protein BHE74_00031413, partial [Ensete ventricosum]
PEVVLQSGFVFFFPGNGVLSFLTVAMEVRSETGIMSSREPFDVAMQKSSAQNQPAIQSMRLAYTQDGTAIYKPVTSNAPPPPPSTSATTLPYQGGGRGGENTGSGVEGPSPIMASHGLNINIGEPVKRKRGRPRKYGPDGIVALAPTSAAASVPPGASGCSPLFPGTTSPVSWADPTKKARGRPSGSGKKQQMAALEKKLAGSAGIGFTPHVITVKTGEGRFEILSLSGSFLLSESGGQRSRTGGLSVSLAGTDGRVLGGGVAGQLTAASPVQVIVGSFIADGRKEKKTTNTLEPMSAPGKPVPAGTSGPSSPPSRGTLSESSGGPGSPLNQSTGTYNNNIDQQGLSSIPWK